MSWLVYSILAFVLFGTWSVLLRYSTGKIDSLSLTVIGAVSSAVLIAIIWYFFRFTDFKMRLTPNGIYLALLIGAVGIIAVFFEILAFHSGLQLVVSPIISLGVVVFIALAGIFIFNEALTIKSAVGLALALAAIYLLSAG